MARKIIIDTDPGQDDAVAILLALSSPADFDILGIVAVAAWTALSLLVHTVQMAQAAILRMRGPLRSWLLP